MRSYKKKKLKLAAYSALILRPMSWRFSVYLGGVLFHSRFNNNELSYIFSREFSVEFRFCSVCLNLKRANLRDGTGLKCTAKAPTSLK